MKHRQTVEQSETKTIRAESVTLIAAAHYIHVHILFGFLDVALHLWGNVKTQFLRHGQGNHGRAHHLDPLPVKEPASSSYIYLFIKLSFKLERNLHVFNYVINEKHYGWPFSWCMLIDEATRPIFTNNELGTGYKTQQQQFR